MMTLGYNCNLLSGSTCVFGYYDNVFGYYDKDIRVVDDLKFIGNSDG